LDEVRSIAEMVMERHPEAFSSEYDKNKKALEELAIIPSKHLRNHIAGYIAKVHRQENSETSGPTEENQAE
jgi:small subunit ribosomal protein S17e